MRATNIGSPNWEGEKCTVTVEVAEGVEVVVSVVPSKKEMGKFVYNMPSRKDRNGNYLKQVRLSDEKMREFLKVMNDLKKDEFVITDIEPD